MREAGLIARTDDRGDAVIQIAPPLISDAALLDEIVDRLGDILTDAGKQIGVAEPALALDEPRLCGRASPAERVREIHLSPTCR